MNILTQVLFLILPSVTFTSEHVRKRDAPFIANPNNPFLRRGASNQQPPIIRAVNVPNNYGQFIANPNNIFLKHDSTINLQERLDAPVRDFRPNPPPTQAPHYFVETRPPPSLSPSPPSKPKESPYMNNPHNPFLRRTYDTDVSLLSRENGCGQPSVAIWKIIGGNTAKKGSWPWIALLGYEKNYAYEIAYQCSGSLISKKHVLTAAHCIKRTLRLVRLGEHSIEDKFESGHIDVYVEQTKPHPEFNKATGHNDIAVVFLSRSVTFTDAISPICVPRKSEIDTRSLVGRKPSLAGWGKTQQRNGRMADTLQEIQLPILSNEECKEKYREKNRLVSEDQFDERVVCAGELTGGMDSCPGDSGGPLMLPEKFNDTSIYFNLIGIISYGIGCGEKDSPGAYTNVAYYSDWIKEKVESW